jgi:hypothetical protein
LEILLYQRYKAIYSDGYPKASGFWVKMC